MRILGLDLGGTTGWAVAYENGGIGASGTWDIVPRRGESPGCRYLHLRRHLNEILAAYDDLAMIVYEAAHHRGGHATEYAIGCVATVQAWCAQRKVEHAAVHTATVKKFATGKGNASKDEMVNAATPLSARFSRREGIVPLDDNEADAIHLARYAAMVVLGAESRTIPMEGAR